MAFVRLLKDLMKDKDIGPRWVPIIPDEARTFGMDSLFPTAKIYSPHGQQYTPVDRELFLSYREATNGQILHEGINEAGSVASFTAAGTSYATHGEPMIPLYIFYSMFGFQRTADGLWAAADQMARGFLLGATAGRTTLNGEGLQHEDGHSHAHRGDQPGRGRLRPGVRRSRSRTSPRTRCTGCTARSPEDIFYYLTVYNEPILQPAEPADVDVDGLLKGLYRYSPAPAVEPTARAAGADPRLRHRHAVGAEGAAAAGPGLGRGRRRVVGDLLDRAAPRRGGRRGVEPAAPRRRRRGCRT